VALGLLQAAGFPGGIHESLLALSLEIEKGAGLAIVAEEAIQGADLKPLSECLRRQPSWSDFPFVLLTLRGGGPERNPAAARLGEILGNVTFLERPFHPTTFLSVVRTAIRGRRRQYEARKHLEELAHEREALSKLTATLEQRVSDRTAQLEGEVRAREQIRDQLLQSQKMESIGKLTGGVAHDFNNLLMAVMGNLELLRKRLPADPRAQRLIDAAIQGAERGASLTQRMLAFARQQDLKTDSTDLEALVLGMRELLERTLGSNVELRFDIAPNLPSAQVDANQIELAILNLAINSRDAMPNGGTIAIGVGQGTSTGRGQMQQGRYLWIKVSDTGSGMDAKTLQMAVEPFFSTKPLGKGTGLGLSMVHGLVSQLGGGLELTSTLGAGTSATLWLPIAATRAAATAPVESAPVASTSTGRILVVDDDPLIAMNTVDMLEDLGHTVIRANSGRRALELLETEPAVDVLMTDHAMPGMTGLELAEIARRKWPNIRVLLATGYADLPHHEKTDLPRLSKPYHQAQLQAEINRLLGGQQCRPAASPAQA
jgi:signal transduction histidine kinase/CheY-like chemotaxis protein